MIAERARARRARRAAAEGDEADALVHVEESGFARFAGSEVHQPTLIRDESVTLRVVRDGKVGCARHEPHRRRRPRGPPPARPRRRTARRPIPTSRPPGARRRSRRRRLRRGDGGAHSRGSGRAARAAIAPRRSTGSSATSRAASPRSRRVEHGPRGLAGDDRRERARHRRLGRRLRLRGGEVVEGGDLDPRRSREAAGEGGRTARRRRSSRARRAVLEPYAFSELLWYFGFTSLNALALLEGRSFFSGRLGEKLFHETFTLVDDGLDPRGLPEGVRPRGRAQAAGDDRRGGRRQDVVWDRPHGQAAAGDEHVSTGHAWRRRRRLGARSGSTCRWPAETHPRRARRAVGDGIYVTRPPLPRHRRPARGDHHRHDARRHLPHRGRQGRSRSSTCASRRPSRSSPSTCSGSSRTSSLVNRSDFYDERYPFGTLVPAVATVGVHDRRHGIGPGL